MIEFTNVSKSYKDKLILRDINMTFSSGEFVAIIGSSGCGKTTLLKMINKLLPMDRGDIIIDGKSIREIPDIKLRREIGYVVQEGGLFPHFTVKENLEIVPQLEGLEPEKREQRINELLDMVNLDPKLYSNSYPCQLSGGQRQRIGIARALAVQPEFIVLDEPISALDVSIRAQVLNLLKKFQREKQVTYLFIAHDLSIVRFISDRIGVIYKGNIVEVADAEELFNFPLHPYTHSLISAIPIPDPQLEKNKVLYTYDPSIHDYSVDKPEFVDIGHNHFVYGNKKEIEEYKALREKGEPLQPITIRKPGEKVKEENHEVHLSKAEDEFLKTPLHDTGSIWYKVLSFFFPIIGIIAAMVYKKKQYYHNYKACKQGALYGFAVLAVILLIFIIALILVVL